MNQQDSEKFNKLLELLNGNLDAARFCWDAVFISEVFDDLYDGDNQVDKATLQDALYTVMTLPNNAFYKANFDYLYPVVELSMGHWFASNKMQNQGGLKTERAHFFRYLGHQIWVAAWAVIHKNALRDSGAFAAKVEQMWDLSTMESLEGFKNEWRK